MQCCDLCGVPLLSIQCTNLNCERSKREYSQDKNARTTKSKPSVAKKSKNLKQMADGSFQIPPHIHLEFQPSLPNFFGYKTDKKSTETRRRAVLENLFHAVLTTHDGAKNRNAIAEFGPSSSTKTKNKNAFLV